MPSRDELRAKAQQLLNLAKAAPDSSESLLYLMRSLECDTQADEIEPDVPHPQARRSS